MKSLYFSFFNSYLNYGNIAWCSTSMTKIKTLYSKQKQAIKALSLTSEDDYSGLKLNDLMKNRYSRHLQIKYLPRSKSNAWS